MQNSITFSKLRQKQYKVKNSISNFLLNIINSFNNLTDNREEWMKDKWDVRKLVEYGIDYNKSETSYYLNFNKINNVKLREVFKKYIKQKINY